MTKNFLSAKYREKIYYVTLIWSLNQDNHDKFEK